VEEAEYHQEDEDVVHRQGLLNQIAGKEFQRLAVGRLAADRAVEIPPEQAGEDEREGNPNYAPGQRFPRRNLMRYLAAKDEQIQGQHEQHEGGETCPQ